MVYTIEYVSDPSPSEALHGLTRKDTTNIRVARGLSPLRERETVLHELLHACWEQAQLPNKYEEKVVSRLHGPLFSLLRENPDVVDWLLS